MQKWEEGQTAVGEGEKDDGKVRRERKTQLKRDGGRNGNGF